MDFFFLKDKNEYLQANQPVHINYLFYFYLWSPTSTFTLRLFLWCSIVEGLVWCFKSKMLWPIALQHVEPCSYYSFPSLLSAVCFRCPHLSIKQKRQKEATMQKDTKKNCSVKRKFLAQFWSEVWSHCVCSLRQVCVESKLQIQVPNFGTYSTYLLVKELPLLTKIKKHNSYHRSKLVLVVQLLPLLLCM